MKLDLKLDSMVKRFTDVEKLIGDPDVFSDQKKYKELMVEYSFLNDIVTAYTKYKDLIQTIADSKEMLEEEDDAEMKEMAKEEIKESEAQVEPLLQELQLLLVPKDPLDGKDIIMEIRAGTGGDEAALFAADLFRMYSRYAEQHKWKVEIMSSNENELGGFKEVIYSISINNQPFLFRCSGASFMIILTRSSPSFPPSNARVGSFHPSLTLSVVSSAVKYGGFVAIILNF